MVEHTLDILGFTTQAQLDELHTAVEKFGERWQAVAEEKENLQKSQAAMFASEKIARSWKDIETNPDPTLLQKRLIDTFEDERLQSAGLENPARIPKGRSTPVEAKKAGGGPIAPAPRDCRADGGRNEGVHWGSNRGLAPVRRSCRRRRQRTYR